MAYKPYNEFTAEQQELINEICLSDYLIEIEKDYFKIGGVIQKNDAGDDIWRPYIKEYKKEAQEINKKYTYLYPFPSSKSGLNTQTFEIL